MFNYMGRMKDIAIEQMNDELQNDDYALSLNNQLRAVEEERDRLKEERDKLREENRIMDDSHNKFLQTTYLEQELSIIELKQHIEKMTLIVDKTIAIWRWKKQNQG